MVLGECRAISGSIAIFGDSEVCSGSSSNPCDATGCCIDWEVASGVGWGCGIVVEFNSTGGIAPVKTPAGTDLVGMRLVLDGTAPPDGYWLGFTQSLGTDYSDFEPARAAPGVAVQGPGTYDVFLPAKGSGAECSATCEGASEDCAVAAAAPYDLVITVRGGLSSASGRLCLESLRLLDAVGSLPCD